MPAANPKQFHYQRPVLIEVYVYYLNQNKVLFKGAYNSPLMFWRTINYYDSYHIQRILLENDNKIILFSLSLICTAHGKLNLFKKKSLRIRIASA